MQLSTTQRKQLKACAHRLSPVVMIGDKGLSSAVLKEIDVNLKSHELIKIRVTGDDRDQRERILRDICEKLQASAVQHIGKILVVYRANADTEAQAAQPKPARLTSPRPNARPVSAARSVRAAPAAPPVRTGPGRSRSAGRTR
ncbi:MAG TPA: ribosome assembly RNA-binding protein YhbY [Burkholderiales bacterium]|nr:ribosome assembly RNA-binding protein YhbY [Burkholderiales bacterium]